MAYDIDYDDCENDEEVEEKRKGRRSVEKGSACYGGEHMARPCTALRKAEAGAVREVLQAVG